uniref:Putative secreted protein n=1 Tax=Anopheles darlingi TaxID=43151 RepID=A0A2M4DJ86_ANODA
MFRSHEVVYTVARLVLLLPSTSSSSSNCRANNKLQHGNTTNDMTKLSYPAGVLASGKFVTPRITDYCVLRRVSDWENPSNSQP